MTTASVLASTPAPLPRSPSGQGGQVGRVGRALRVVATAVVGGLLLAGTFWGRDADFPFGPFRMYATATKASTSIQVAALRAEWSDGTHTAVQPEELGLRRAELEGQLPRFRAHPELLGALAPHLRTRAGKTLKALVLERRGRRVVDGRVQPTEVVDDARWEVPGS